MTIEKLPSGSYRVRKTIDGKRISVTFDHKPTEAEIIAALYDRALVQKHRPRKSMTVQQAIESYIDYKRDTFSVSTVREYTFLHRRLSPTFLNTQLADLTQDSFDDEIRRLKRSRNKSGQPLSPKTIRNYLSMASAAIRKYHPHCVFSLDLIPTKAPTLEEPYIPTREEVRQILEYVNEHCPMYYCALSLAAFCGLRRSEILSLRPEDIDEDYMLHIDSAMVRDENDKWVEKGTKTVASTRLVPCPKQLADRIRMQGYVYHGFPHSISKSMRRVQRILGFRECSLHKLRHFWATELAEAGVPEADLLYLGGWERGSDVLRNIYRHARIKDDMRRRQELINSITSSFFNEP